MALGIDGTHRHPFQIYSGLRYAYVDELQGGATAAFDTQSFTSLNVAEVIVIRSLLQSILNDVG